MSWVIELKDKHKDKWEETFNKIKNKSLRIKVASLIWWDCQRDKASPTFWNYHKKLMRQYIRIMETDYTIDQIEEVLIEIGYPKEVAIQSAKKPNDTRGV